MMLLLSLIKYNLIAPIQAIATSILQTPQNSRAILDIEK
jgi:hypothetical protein